MAPNRQRGLQRIATEIQGRGQSADPGTFANAVIDGGEERAFETAASVFKGVSDKVGALADHAAKVEGAQAGRLAGLDPEFRTSRQMTIRGEAFDAAGLDVFKAKTRQTIDAELEGLALKHGDDATALKGAISDLRSKYLIQADQNTPELRPDIELQFVGRETALMRQISRRVMAKRVAEQRVAIADELSDGLKGLHQRAFALGLDPTSDAVLADEMARLRGLLGRNGADGQPLYSPAQRTKLLMSAEREVADARLLGAFDRTAGLKAKQAFIEKFEDDFKNSKGLAKEYDFDGFRAVSGLLKRELSRAETAERAEATGLRNEVTNVVRLAEKGFPVPPSELAGLRGRIAQSGNPELGQFLDAADGLLKWQQTASASSPMQLSAWLDAERARLKKDGASPSEVARLEMGDKLLAEMRTELKRDPLSWAERTGLMQIVPVRWGQQVDDGTGAVVDLDALDLRKRRAQAEAVAVRYGQAPRYFTEDDRAQLAQVAMQGGQPLVRLARTLANGFGDKADEAFAEIAKAGKLKGASLMAQLGGLVKNNANPAIIRDVANGLALRRVPEFKSVAPSLKDAQPVFNEAFGDALIGLRQTREVLLDMARAVYDVRAKGEASTDFDEKLYESIVSELSGEVRNDGVAYGGIANHRAGLFDGATSRKVLVPAGVAQHRFDDVIGLITNADLEGTGQVPYDVKGNILKADAVRRGTYVSAGSGKYRIALGNDLVADPQWIHDKAGRPLLFDLEVLLPRLKQRKPEYFMGGR